jgi:hypothetical protein
MRRVYFVRRWMRFILFKNFYFNTFSPHKLHFSISDFYVEKTFNLQLYY